VEHPDQFAGADVKGSEVAGRSEIAFAGSAAEDDQVFENTPRSSRGERNIGAVDAGLQIQLAVIGEGIDVLATRIKPDVADVLVSRFPGARYNSSARTLRIPFDRSDTCNVNRSCAPVAVVSAGTSDISVAEEARETLDWMGIQVRMIHDVGVAGPHRLRERLHQLEGVAAVVVCAGMEGALPSVVGGYVSCPVIAVPTSVGYGANCGGLAALLSMLNSCAANVTVVNIDAGFKGGYVAGLIASRAAKSHKPVNAGPS
jgi:NCAIR mutase (PurE)-related protein